VKKRSEEEATKFLALLSVRNGILSSGTISTAKQHGNRQKGSNALKLAAVLIGDTAHLETMASENRLTFLHYNTTLL
jgi:hypothetical protein